MTDHQQIQAALSFVPAHDRDVWCKIGMAVKVKFVPTEGGPQMPVWTPA